jgi:hypothetical protein
MTFSKLGHFGMQRKGATAAARAVSQFFREPLMNAAQ